MIPSLQDLRGLTKHIPERRLRKLGNGRNRADVPYEAILVDQHAKSANCNTFVTNRNRILPWILALSEYYSSCNGTKVLYTWYNEGTEVSLKAGTITKLRLQVSRSDTSDKPTHTITVFIKTGLIMIQGNRFAEFGKSDFPKVKALVESHVVKDADTSRNDPMNSTSITESPGHAAAAMPPGVSPIKNTDLNSDDEYDTASERDISENDDTLHEQTVLSKSLSVACGNIDTHISSLHETLSKKSDDNTNALKKLQSENRKSSGEIKQKVEAVSTSNEKIEEDIAKLKTDVALILDIVKAIDKRLPLPPLKRDAETITEIVPDVEHSAKTVESQKPAVEAHDIRSASGTPDAKDPDDNIPKSDATNAPNISNSTEGNQNASPSSKWSWVRDSTPYVNSTTENLVLSDSLSRDVDQNQLDPSGRTQVKSFGGATTSSLNKKLAHFPKSNNVRNVLTHIGFNDTQLEIQMTRTHVTMLLDSIANKFPRAKITVSAVLPTKYGYIEKINNFNRVLGDVCQNKKVKLVDFGASFQNNKELYSKKDGDNVHLDDDGTEILLRRFQETLGLQTTKPLTTPVPRSDKVTETQVNVKQNTAEIPSNSLNQKEMNDNRNKDNIESAEKEGQKIETVISDRSDTVASDVTIESPSMENEPDEMKYIHPQTVQHGNIFQAFGAPCHSHKEASDFCERIKAEFPATKDATSFMVAYSFDQKGDQCYSYENDGENGAGQRMIKMMDAIGMKNTCIVITRHYKGKMFGARWSIMQSQMCKIARMMKYTVPADMNIHKFFPRTEGDNYSRRGYRSQQSSYDNNGYTYNNDGMRNDQRELLQWQQMVFNKLATQIPQMPQTYQPSFGYSW